LLVHECLVADLNYEVCDFFHAMERYGLIYFLRAISAVTSKRFGWMI